MSQIATEYRDSRLSAGRAGAVHGGDRLRWVPTTQNNRDDVTPLTSLRWQVHVYGEADPGIESACQARQLPLHVFPWRQEMSRTGLQRHAVYLVRPDGYVGLARPHGAAKGLIDYLDARKLARVVGEC